MKEDQLDLIRKTIRKSIAQTDERIAEYEELTNPIAPENAIGRVSRMDAINNKSIYEEALRKAEKKKRALESALARLDEDGFEKCVQCGNEIRFERLELMPESRLCISCARRR
jgi:DnaK suppressor protein